MNIIPKRIKIVLLGSLAIPAAVAVVAVTNSTSPAKNLDVSAYTVNSVTVKWSAAAGATGYRLYRDGTAVSTAGASATSAKFGSLTFASHVLGVEPLPDGGISTLTAEGKWLETASSEPPPPSSDTAPPSVPTNQVISNITQTGLKMSWSASNDNVGVVGYKLFRNNAEVTQVTGLTYTYTGLTCNTAYLVGLTAVDAAGNQSNVAYAQGTVTTATCGTPPPPPPPPPAACADNLDNDGDGLIDLNDPGCASATDNDETNSTTPPPTGSIAPGQSWQTAYNNATAGSTLSVLAGNHGAPALTGSKAVTFLGVNGAYVTTMPGSASNVTFQNIDVDTGSTRGPYSATNATASNITWKQVDVRGNVGQVYINGGGTNFKWLGGSFAGGTTRNCPDSEPVWVDGDNATIDGVAFGAFHAGDCNGDNFHLEDIRVQGADDFSILNSTFANQSDAGSGHIFITTTSPSDSQAKRMRIEGNTFAPVIGTYAIQAHTNVTSYDHYVIKNNRWDQPVLMDSPFTALIACGNTGQTPASWKVAC